MSEKLCLKWNDNQENIKDTFRHMREYNDFSYVTLVCEMVRSAGGGSQGDLGCFKSIFSKSYQEQTITPLIHWFT